MNFSRYLSLLAAIWSFSAFGYEWLVPTSIRGQRLENGKMVDYIEKGPGDVYVSSRTSQLFDGDQVTSERTLLDRFAKLGLTPGFQKHGTCVGHALGQLLDYEIALAGGERGSKIMDLQLFLQLLSNEYFRLYEDPSALESDVGPYRYMHGSEVFDYNIRQNVDVDIVGGTSFASMQRLFKQYPEVCRVPKQDPDISGDTPKILSTFNDFKSGKIDLKRAIHDIQFALWYQPEKSSIPLESMLREEKNPFDFAIELYYPACRLDNNFVSIAEVTKRLKVSQRGQGMLVSNAELEHGLYQHFQKEGFRPLAVGYCTSFNNERFLHGNGPPDDVQSRRLIYESEGSDAYPWENYQDPSWITIPIDVTENCGQHFIQNGHAALVMGVREVRLKNGEQRVDYLIEDSSKRPANLPFWQNAEPFHFWVDAKTLVANITEIAEIEARN